MTIKGKQEEQKVEKGELNKEDGERERKTVLFTVTLYSQQT